MAQFSTGGTYGSPRVHVELAETRHVFVSRKRIIRIMQQEGLKARVRKRFKRTTMRDHDQPVAANLLDRQFTADRPNQRWVGDTTELLTGNAKLAPRRHPRPVLEERRRVGALPVQRPLRHDESARHSHPAAPPGHWPAPSLRPGQHLRERGLPAHPGRPRHHLQHEPEGDVFDNAAMESWNSTFKMECGERFESNATPEEEVFDYIQGFYNPQRRHSAVGYISPTAFERAARERQVA